MRKDSQNLIYTYCYRCLHYVMKFHPWFHRRLEFHFRHLHWKKPFSLSYEQIKNREVRYQIIVLHMFKYTTLKQQTRRWLILKKLPSDVKSLRSSSTSSLMTVIQSFHFVIISVSFRHYVATMATSKQNTVLQPAAVIQGPTLVLMTSCNTSFHSSIKITKSVNFFCILNLIIELYCNWTVRFQKVFNPINKISTKAGKTIFFCDNVFGSWEMINKDW